MKGVDGSACLTDYQVWVRENRAREGERGESTDVG